MSGVRHIPVMRSEALGALGLTPGGVFVDGTFGAGGYTAEILASFPDVRVFAFDRDPTAIAAGAALAAASKGRLQLVENCFSSMAEELEERGAGLVDGIVLDIGVSSMQVDDALRGFSFRHDAPLDMRMGNAGESAADIVNGASEAHLADIIHFYGEERFARPVARALVRARGEQSIATTRQLADIVSRVVRARPNEIHPATRTFQALRIAVNDELGELARVLHAAERVLKPGGALVVVSFHSLEDRIVKLFFAGRTGRIVGSRHQPQAEMPATFRVATGQPHQPEEDEIAFNPRARSARLRWGVRTDMSAAAIDGAVMARAMLPSAAQDMRKARGR
jgi:16S rRNA (cytosine1402-N4)-methyltransferase